MKYLSLLLALFVMLCFSAQSSAATQNEQRAEIKKMQTSALNALYKTEPGSKQQIAKAVGYAVFSSATVAVGFFSGSYGHGVAHDNRNGGETYMQMAAAGVGLGLGVKDFRVIFVFNNVQSFRDFVTTGLDLSGHLDVAAKQGAKGGALSGAQDILPGVTVYQMTDTGLLAQAMLKGTKYWRDGGLNNSNFSQKPARYNY